MAFPKRFSLNFAKSMPFAPLYSISMQYFYPNAISFRLFYRIKYILLYGQAHLALHQKPVFYHRIPAVAYFSDPKLVLRYRCKPDNQVMNLSVL